MDGNGPVRDAERLLREAVGDRLRRDFRLASLTTFRLGGTAALYLEAESNDDLAAVGAALRETGLPLLIIGKGSNLLVADEGFSGIAVRLGRSFRWTARNGNQLTAGGSMPLPALAGVALGHRLTGLEFGVAIPASIGGAVRMNAGAHGHALSEVVDSLEIYDLDGQSLRVVPVTEAGFAYRESALPPASVIVGATLLLRPGEEAEIRSRMHEAREWRRATQPLSEPNCGSVFKNPPGDHAARLIEAIGAKGLTVGGASVATKHANFIVADPGATASDVRRLISMLQERVRERFGIDLELEVHLVGNFNGHEA